MESDVADEAGVVTASGTGRGTRRNRAVLLVLALIVAFDQLTKSWAVSALADGPIHVFGDTVELRLGRNSGSAFSTLRGATPLLAVAAIALSFVLARVLRRATDRWMVAGLVLVLGGALGNLADRLARAPGFLRGHVVDFVSVGWWPVFNLADSCITVGAVVLVVHTWRTPEPKRAAGAHHG